ncbi:MAG: hypothetical protein HKN57_06815 [Xanthomonadales bacterium]|nr:hypothetical protein [Gammaproteobacteria bacterium]MBT8055226.1 hypothetical protein [Gammaproteobacteria bacterium]NND56944.1 hypothetical protein [Xanthomonadales bacterium]NNK51902.1 hypothetical protein [Xanthomonadales bacterium]
MATYLKSVLWALWLVWPAMAMAGLFDETEVIEISLSGPVSSILDDTEHRKERPFVLGVDGREIEILARVRGKSRARVCKFPPIRLNFSESDAQQTVFGGQGKLKVVTHCRNNSQGSTNVLEEYLIYRMFNVLTDISFRARLLHIEYNDTDGKLHEDASPNYGFLIESGKQVENRTGGEWVKLPAIAQSRLAQQHAGIVFVFQYLIGNTDWSFVLAEDSKACCHNGDLLELESRLYYVPYDFDLAGLVDAPYAKPDPSIGIRSVTQRRYRGYCIENEPVAAALRLVNSKKAEILEILQELPDYSDKSMKKSVKFLEGFFKKAGDEERLLKTFEKRCLG